jgi:hypothetical protein
MDSITRPVSDNKAHKSIMHLLLLSSLVVIALTLYNLPVVQASFGTLVEPEPLVLEPYSECVELQCHLGIFNIATTEVPLTKADQYSLDLLVGTKLEPAIPAIKEAAIKHGVPVGFFTGIAYAESSVHENYYIDSDKELCHNAWGLKPRTGVRSDGSYLVCFTNWHESADYLGRLLREGFLDHGATTVSSIAPYYKCGGYDGTDWCLATMDNWIRNVNTFSHF